MKLLSTYESHFLSGIFFLFSMAVNAQETQSESLDELFKVNYDTPLTLDLKTQDSIKNHYAYPKKKKIRKNVFFGLKTRKGFARTGFGNNVIYEIFHMLKEYKDPPPYARDYFWFDYKKKSIVNSLKVKKEQAGILHGPYKKMLGDMVLEEGMFYMGMKHRRWVRYNKYDILQDKEYWWKGWPQESLLSYYDFRKTKLREVIPVHYGEKDGEYWAFHQDGTLAVRGKYKFDYKVGTWREYYDIRRVKREVKYSENPFDFEFKPHILREWDKKGQLIYDRARYLKSLR